MIVVFFQIPSEAKTKRFLATNAELSVPASEAMEESAGCGIENPQEVFNALG